MRCFIEEKINDFMYNLVKECIDITPYHKLGRFDMSVRNISQWGDSAHVMLISKWKDES